MKRILLALALALTASGCAGALQGGTISLGPPNRPAAFYVCGGNVDVQIKGPGIGPSNDVGLTTTTGADGVASFAKVPGNLAQLNLFITAEGYQPYGQVVNLPAGTGPILMFTPDCQPNIPNRALLPPLVPLLPPALTRDQALAVHTSFQGLWCPTAQFGGMPLFGPAIPWLLPSDRQMVYACEKAAGDTAIDLSLPSGPPLYDESNQFYTSDKFGPLDWTVNQTSISPALADQVVEAARAGLAVILHMDERQPISQWEIGAVLDALATSKYGDLRNYVAYYLPGYDGIFYGWPNDQIATWFATARAHCADCRFGLEFSIGHLPQEGNVDLSNVDALVVEFPVDNVHDNNNFGIVERLIGPAYVRPSDDVAPNDGGDSHPRPFLSNVTARGPRQTICGEYSTYSWVRNIVTAAAVAVERSYLVAEGCPVTW